MTRVLALLAVAALACPALVVPGEFAPQNGVEETLKFDGGVYGGFAVTGQYEYHAAVRFTPENPCSLRAVIFYQQDASAEDGRVYVYGANTSSRPGTRLASVTYPGAGTQRWKRVNITPPVPVDSGVDFWTCVTTTHFTGDHPLSVDGGPMVRTRGGFIKVPLMGETWYQLTAAPFYVDRNWNQRAIVFSLTGIEEELGPAEPARASPRATVVRSVLILPRPPAPDPRSRASLLDAAGRTVMALRAGDNDVSGLAPGIYFVVTPHPVPFDKLRAGSLPQGERERPTAVAKVVVAR
ncbi:MAG: DUF4082 domain-containing protein [bacterium]